MWRPDYAVIFSEGEAEEQHQEKQNPRPKRRRLVRRNSLDKSSGALGGKDADSADFEEQIGEEEARSQGCDEQNPVQGVTKRRKGRA